MPPAYGRTEGADHFTALQVDLQLLNVGELHIQAVSAAPAVTEVHLPERLTRELTQLLLAGTGILSVEQAGRMLRRPRRE